MLRTVRHTLEMIRFSHTLFALPFALLAALMAWAQNAHDPHGMTFRWLDLVGILLCMITARSAAMAFNRLADRRIDALNPRTRSRHLPAGVLSVATVSLFTVACSLGFILSTLLFLPRNILPLLASVPVLLFLLGYSYAKRFTFLAHLWLGTALAMAPVAAWVVIRAEVAWPPIVLAVAVALWVTGFDIIYACQDYTFDVEMNLHSVPAKTGVANALHLAAVCHLGTVIALAALPWVYPLFGVVYLSGVCLISLLLCYEHWLVRPNDLSRVSQAFFTVNAVISLGLFAVGALDLLLLKWHV